MAFHISHVEQNSEPLLLLVLLPGTVLPWIQDVLYTNQSDLHVCDEVFSQYEFNIVPFMYYYLINVGNVEKAVKYFHNKTGNLSPLCRTRKVWGTGTGFSQAQSRKL